MSATGGSNGQLYFLDVLVSIKFTSSASVINMYCWANICVNVCAPPQKKKKIVPAFPLGGKGWWNLLTSQRETKGDRSWRAREGGEGRRRERICLFVSWCLEPSQTLRVTSGLNTNSNLSLSYSAHKSFDINHNISIAQLFQTYTHTQHHTYFNKTTSFLYHSWNIFAH